MHTKNNEEDNPSRSVSAPGMPDFRRRAACTVRTTEADRTILAFLSLRFPYRTSFEWQQLLAEERLILNHRTATEDMVVAAKDRVEFKVPEKDEPPVNSVYSVLFEDDCLLVVNKSGNLPIHPAGRFFNHTLWALLKRDRPEMPVHFVNRLDRETSGIVVVAKGPEIAGRCAAALAHPDAAKIYTAIVEGEFPYTLQAEGVLTPHPRSRVRKKLAFVPTPGSSCAEQISRLPDRIISARDYEPGDDRKGGAKRIATSFKKIGGDNQLSILAARLRSGQTHQIRATLESLGFPLVGDKLYGVDEAIFLRFINDSLTDADRRRLRLDRQALHAARLTFTHPDTLKPIDITAPIPEDMATCLDQKFTLAGPIYDALLEFELGFQSRIAHD